MIDESRVSWVPAPCFRRDLFRRNDTMWEPSFRSYGGVCDPWIIVLYRPAQTQHNLTRRVRGELATSPIEPGGPIHGLRMRWWGLFSKLRDVGIEGLCGDFADCQYALYNEAAMKAMVMLPTYNEKDSIARLVNQILAFDNTRIVVVDDSSPDGTGEIADMLAGQNPGRVWVIHRQEKGRGTAGIAGFRYALEQDTDCIIEMDADFSHDPKYIPQFLDKISKYDVVIGSRLVKGGKSTRTPLRRIISDGANLSTRLLLGWCIKDWCGGFKCYRRVALGSLEFDRFYSTGYSIGMETLYRLKKKGLSFVEIPIEFTDTRTGASKFSAKEVIMYMATVLRLRFSV